MRPQEVNIDYYLTSQLRGDIQFRALQARNDGETWRVEADKPHHVPLYWEGHWSDVMALAKVMRLRGWEVKQLNEHRIDDSVMWGTA